MANKHFKSKKLSERKKWLYRYIKIDFETGNYSDVLDASKDLIALIDDAKTSPYKNVSELFSVEVSDEIMVK